MDGGTARLRTLPLGTGLETEGNPSRDLHHKYLAGTRAPAKEST